MTPPSSSLSQPLRAELMAEAERLLTMEEPSPWNGALIQARIQGLKIIVRDLVSCVNGPHPLRAELETLIKEVLDHGRDVDGE